MYGVLVNGVDIACLTGNLSFFEAPLGFGAGTLQ